MHRRVICGILALWLVCGAVGCASFSSTPQSVSWLDVFDTVTTFKAYGMDEDTFATLSRQVHQRLTYYHQLFDIYHTYEGVNNLKTVNDAAGTPVVVERPIIDLLTFGTEAYARTNGRVNILFGSVLRLWHEGRQTATLPDPAALQAAGAHTDITALHIDPKAGTVRITDPSASLDVGAVAKGYAVEQTAAYLRELGITSVLLDVGGNVRAIGDKGGAPFAIGVQNPDTDSAVPYLQTVGLRDCAAVTSGDYQRYFEVAGERYAHIIDPDTLYPAAFVRAVTVVCPDSGTADVLSTALYTLSVEEGLALLARFPAAEAVWVLSDGSLRYSTDFEVLLL